MHADEPRRDDAAPRTTAAIRTGILADRPTWLVDLLLATSTRAWQRERIELPDAASLDEVRHRLNERTTQLERETGPRLLFVDWTLAAGAATLRPLLEPNVVEDLLDELRRSASHAPRTIWPASLAAVPTEESLRRFDAAESYTGHFVRRWRESLADPRSDEWTDDEFRDLSADLSVTPAELRAFLARAASAGPHDGKLAPRDWDPSVLAVIPSDPETGR